MTILVSSVAILATHASVPSGIDRVLQLVGGRDTVVLALGCEPEDAM